VIMTCDILAETRETVHNVWVQEYRRAFEEYGQKATVEDERNFKAEGMQIKFEQTLNEWVELQMFYLDLTINFPAEQLEAIKNEELKNYDANLPQMMEQYGVTNRYDLDMELRKFGTTLERKRAATVEKHLALGWFAQIAKMQDSSLTPTDMRAYYERLKEEKYKKTGYAKWEELAVLFSEVPNEQEAYAKIAALGNRVQQQGEEFAEVARNGSQGLTSHRGGERKAEVGTLQTKTLEKAVFSLPIGQMSRIFREDTGPFAGLYIVRVQERQQTHYTPFESVQNEIQKSINDERRVKEQERVLAELRKKYLVEVSPYLQQVVAMAVETERKLPIVDTPERHEKMLALAGRLAPPKKEPAPRQQNQTAVAMAPQRSQGQVPTQTNVTETPHTPPINRPDTRSGNRDSTWEPGLGTTVDKKGEETRKENVKGSFWNTINPFR
jgi:PPIC-type PPIASE domain.